MHVHCSHTSTYSHIYTSSHPSIHNTKSNEQCTMKPQTQILPQYDTPCARTCLKQCRKIPSADKSKVRIRILIRHHWLLLFPKREKNLDIEKCQEALIVIKYYAQRKKSLRRAHRLDCYQPTRSRGGFVPPSECSWLKVISITRHNIQHTYRIPKWIYATKDTKKQTERVQFCERQANVGPSSVLMFFFGLDFQKKSHIHTFNLLWCCVDACKERAKFISSKLAAALKSSGKHARRNLWWWKCGTKLGATPNAHMMSWDFFLFFGNPKWSRRRVCDMYKEAKIIFWYLKFVQQK